MKKRKFLLFNVAGVYMKPQYAWPGLYPLVYFNLRGAPICYLCSTECDKAEIHWEGEPIECSECDQQTESAYGPLERKESWS